MASSQSILEWVKVIGPILISWPAAVLIVALVLRGQIEKLVDAFVKGDGGSLEFGSLKMELGKVVEDGQDAVDRLRRINETTAQSRVLELEIMMSSAASIFLDSAQKERIEDLIKTFHSLLGSTPLT